MESAWERLKVNDGTMGLYVSLPEGPGPFPAVIVMQHRDGVDEFVQEMTRRLAREGYISVAPEIYHRDGPDCRDDGPTRAARLRDANVIQDVNAALDYLKGHRSVQPERVGIVGFCQGGRVAYLMAGVSPSLKASVVYYGGSIFGARGEGPSPFERSSGIHCPIMGHFGEEDANPSPEDMRKLDLELAKHGKVHEFYAYPGAGHAFMNFAAESYRAHAEQASWPRTLDFLKRCLWVSHDTR